MANKKNHYYILVFTNNGPVYVTSVKYTDRMSYWNKLERPLEMSKSTAEDICLGLNLNGHMSVVVLSKWEIDTQPYRYDAFEFEAKEIENK